MYVCLCMCMWLWFGSHRAFWLKQPPKTIPESIFENLLFSVVAFGRSVLNMCEFVMYMYTHICVFVHVYVVVVWLS